MSALISRVIKRLGSWKQYVWRIRDRWIPQLPLLHFLDEGGILLLKAGDKVGEALYKGWYYEDTERKFVASFLRKGMVVFDIGANFGLYTLIAARRVGTSGCVYSFEPSPNEYENLHLNIRINRLQNVKINQLAVGDQNNEIVLNVYGDGWGAYSTIGRAVDVDAPCSAVVVKQVALDQYIYDHRITRLDFVKVDVEGAELNVLLGGASIIWRGLRPIVMCEFSDKRTSPLGYMARELWQYLVALDYLWFRVAASSGKLLPSQMKQQYNYENLIAIPAEKVSGLDEWLES